MGSRIEFHPHPYQQRAVQWILEHDNCGLLLDMGLGKTVTTLTALQTLIYDHMTVGKVLVVAPLRVAMTVWQEEAEKWSHLQGLSFSKILGTREQRILAINRNVDIYIVNRENLAWLVDTCIKSKRPWKWDTVVLDELSSFKSSRSERFKALRRVRPKISRMIGLTGTPAPNGLMDLFSQIYLLDGGERLGRTLGGYRDRYFTPGKRNGNIVYEWKAKPEAEQAIYSKLSDLCISMTAADYLELPERREITIPVVIPERQKQIYDKLEKEMLIELEGETITAANAAVVTGKLLQMSNGALYDEQRGVHEIHTAKLDALQELIEEANGKPVLVYYGYKHDLSRIMERIPSARQLSTADDVKAWNAGQIPVLLAHPASAGHGLNLQSGGHIIIWYGLTWSLELYQQANARLYRQGQKEGVTIYHLVSCGTMDENVMRMLTVKDQRQGALIEALKERGKIT